MYNANQSIKSTILHKTLSSDIITPVLASIRLGIDNEHGFLLESVIGGERNSRYSFIGARPDLIWECTENQAKILQIKYEDHEKQDVVKHYIDGCKPIESLKKLVRAHKLTMPPKIPSMSSGLFGYLSYDMIRHVENLPNLLPSNINIPDSVLIRPSIIVVFDHVMSVIYITTTIWCNEYSDLQPASDSDYQYMYMAAEKRLEWAAEKIFAGDWEGKGKRSYRKSQDIADGQQQGRGALPAINEVTPIAMQSNTEQQEYHEIVDKAKQYIHDGDIFQIVPSQRFTAEFSHSSFALYRALRYVNPSPYLFYFNLAGDYNLSIVGASPEILVKLHDNQVTIRPIAGTRHRGKNEQEDQELAQDLLADHKECAEHLMLLDLGRNDVGRVAKAGTVRVTEKFIIEYYSHVMHIVSNVVGELDFEHYDAVDALMAGFPAGTVSGAPKIRAMEIIEELEKERRSFYAGAMGYFSANGDMDSAIMLRTALVKDGMLYVQAGGGVVADSDPEAEYQETMNKSRALKVAAALAKYFE